MKKILVLLFALFIGIGAAQAENMFLETNVNLDNYLEKIGKEEKKVLSVYEKILTANKIDKRLPIYVKRDWTTVNASSNLFYKNITINRGVLLYTKNDDELAAIIAHEIAHSLEAYGSIFKITAMTINAQKYETQADLRSIDYMVKAGYNPVAAITFMNKVSTEPHFDWGIIFTHPKGSKRLLSMYKYIYVKYPQYLNSEMTSSPYYLNFTYAMNKEIKNFQNEQKKRMSKNKEIEL